MSLNKDVLIGVLTEKYPEVSRLHITQLVDMTDGLSYDKALFKVEKVLKDEKELNISIGVSTQRHFMDFSNNWK